MMPTATYNFREGYRYGFNGQEKDDNIKGAGNSYDFGGRSIYDGRLGRFISVDEYAKVVPNKSPYGYAGNNPIKFIDKDGGFQLPAEDKANYPVLDNILQNLYQFATENPNVIESFIKNSGLDEATAKEYIEYAKSSPMINVESALDVNGMGATTKAGQIQLNRKDVLKLEKQKTKVEKLIREGASDSKILKEKSKLAKQVSNIIVTVLHEGVHKGDIEVNGQTTDVKGRVVNPKQGFDSRNGERGFDFEEDAFGEVVYPVFIDQNSSFANGIKQPDNFLKKMAGIVFGSKSNDNQSEGDK